VRVPRFHVYEAVDGWRWRLLSANGRTVADSGEAYTRRRDCVRAVRTATSTAIEARGAALRARR
jgi:uncharacterized protein YegP (UPF0339 family)